MRATGSFITVAQEEKGSRQQLQHCAASCTHPQHHSSFVWVQAALQADSNVYLQSLAAWDHCLSYLQSTLQ